MSLTPGEIRQVLDILANSQWDEAMVTIGDVTIAVARNGASLPTASPAAAPAVAPIPAAAPAAPAAAAPAPAAASATVSAPPAGGTAVTAPSVGVFWRAPEPGAAPFVEVGARVEAGQDMCIVEVMKLMNRVPAPCSGVVSHIHVGNGEAVEYGSPLFTIAPE
jgi:acetyl-CoA carboxylase biotin carboxyl carrier protein